MSLKKTQPTTMTCSLTREEFLSDIAVCYEANDTPEDVSKESRRFHDLLVAVSASAGKLPLGVHLRYGTDVLDTFRHASSDMREAMIRAVTLHIPEKNRPAWTAEIMQSRLPEPQVKTQANTDIVDTVPADTTMPHAHAAKAA